MENELIRADLSRITAQITTRQEMSEVVRVIVDRIGNFKSLGEHRFDQLIAILQSKP